MIEGSKHKVVHASTTDADFMALHRDLRIAIEERLVDGMFHDKVMLSIFLDCKAMLKLRSFAKGTHPFAVKCTGILASVKEAGAHLALQRMMEIAAPDSSLSIDIDELSDCDVGEVTSEYLLECEIKRLRQTDSRNELHTADEGVQPLNIHERLMLELKKFQKRRDWSRVT